MNKLFYNFTICFLFTTQVFIASTASATDYFVHAGIGNNSNDGRFPESAFRDLKYSMQQLSSGDTLHVRSGTYLKLPNWMTSDKYKSGTAAQPITVKPYQNEKPMISSTTPMNIVDLSWWVFEDLVFQNSIGIYLGDNSVSTPDRCASYAENITVRGSRFQHSDKAGITIKCARHIVLKTNLFDNLRSRVSGVDLHAILFVQNVNDVVISGNTFSDIGADGIQFGNSTSAEFRNILITENEFKIRHPYTYRDVNEDVIPAGVRPFDSVGENAIDIKRGPGPIVISNNRVHGFRPTLAGQDASGDPGSGIAVHINASGITLARNLFYDNIRHLVIQKGAPAPGGNLVQNVIVKGNIFKDVKVPSGAYEGKSIRESALRVSSVKNIQVFNNTFFQTIEEGNTLLFLLDISNISLMNNVFRKGTIITHEELATSYPGNFDVDASNNAWSEIVGPLNEDLTSTNDVIADKLFMDWLTWTPLKKSPLIDAGVRTGGRFSAHGTPISGQGPDIGAGEYQHNQSGDSALLADLQIKQGERPARVIYSDGGAVEITATVRDPASEAKHNFDWSQSDNSLILSSGYDERVLHIEPSSMSPGIYRAHVSITNDGTPPQRVEIEILFRVRLTTPNLDENLDSDGDGNNDLSEGIGDTDQDGIPDYLDAIDSLSVLQGRDGISDRYLLMTESGLSLRLGSIAIENGRQSAGLMVDANTGEMSNMLNDQSYTYSSGVYDFEITGLARVGQSVNVVLPQLIPIPANATFRKYLPTSGWQAFVINDFNNIASAQAKNGICPPPGDVAYRQQLIEGYDCIQLTLEDGGPNDADGLRNGVIQDPSGIGEAVVPSSSTNTGGSSSNSNSGDGSSGGGGCSLGSVQPVDPTLFLLLVAALAGIRSKLISRKIPLDSGHL